MKKKLFDGPIPFHPKTGDLMHYPEDIGCYPDRREPDWRPNIRFTSAMKIKDYSRGRSAAYFILEDNKGVKYPMFLKDFMEVVPFFIKGEILADWAFCKRGQNYGLILVNTA